MSYDTMIQLLIQYRYLILFPIAFFEGPMTAFIVGTLISLGYLAVIPSLLIMALGDFIPDTFYYLVGYRGKRKKFISAALEKVNMNTNMYGILHHLWHRHMFKSLFFSKIAYGFSIPLLISAGIAEMPFRLFIRYSLIITFIQYGILMMLGYFMGNLFSVVKDTVSIIGIVGASVVLVIIGYVVLARYVKKIFIREIQHESAVDTQASTHHDNSDKSDE